jgi:hypothetical protein
MFVEGAFLFLADGSHYVIGEKFGFDFDLVTRRASK